MSRIFAVLFSLVVLVTGCTEAPNQRPSEFEFWKDASMREEARANEWRLRALFQLDRFKQVCDGSDFNEKVIAEWRNMVANTAHAGALSGGWEPWARKRIELFRRNHEWKRACNEAWALPEPKK